MCLGIPGQIIEVADPEQLLAKVDVAGVKRWVNIACVLEEGVAPDTLLGEWVLVHVGFAMSLINQQEAARTLALLAELSELDRENEAMLGQSLTEDRL